MKKTILAATLFAAAFAASAGAQAQVNVSVHIGQPDFYGRIDVGDYPAPQLLYAQPVIVQRPVHYVGRPIYLRVPPGHAKNWSRHCRAYNACNQEVYFVQDNWYKNQYAPRYRQQHGHPGRPAHYAHPAPPPPHHDGRPGHGPRPHEAHGKPDRHDHDGRPDRGPGRGNGHGNGGGHERGNDRRN